MIVVDASVLANALVYADERGRRARAVLARDLEWAAPEHGKADVFSVLRGLTIGRKIAPAVGERGVARIVGLGIESVPMQPSVVLRASATRPAREGANGLAERGRRRVALAPVDRAPSAGPPQ